MSQEIFQKAVNDAEKQQCHVTHCSIVLKVKGRGGKDSRILIISDVFISFYRVKRSPSRDRTMYWPFLTRIFVKDNVIDLEFGEESFRFETQETDLILRKIFSIIQRVLSREMFSSLNIPSSMITKDLNANGRGTLSRFIGFCYKSGIQKIQLVFSVLKQYLSQHSTTFDFSSIDVGSAITPLMRTLCQVPFCESIILSRLDKNETANTFTTLIKYGSHNLQHILIKGQIPNEFWAIVSKMSQTPKVQLTGISFLDCNFTEKDLISIQQLLISKKMKSICLQNSLLFTKFSMPYNTFFIPNITENLLMLNLDKTPRLNLDQLFQCVPNIYSLSLSGCELDIINILNCINQRKLSKLILLNISHNFCKSNFTEIKFPKFLLRLDVNGISFDSNKLALFFENLMNNEWDNGLILSMSSIKASESDWNQLFESMGNIKKIPLLRLSWTDNQIDHGSFYSFLSICTRLQYLNISRCLTSNLSSVFYKINNSISNLPLLNTIILTGHEKCPLQNALEPFLTNLINFRSLRILDISNNLIDNNTFHYVAKLLSKNVSIHTINLDGSQIECLDPYKEIIGICSQKFTPVYISWPTDDISRLFKQNKISVTDISNFTESLLKIRKVFYDKDCIPDTKMPLEEPFEVFKLDNLNQFPNYVSDEISEIFVKTENQANEYEAVPSSPIMLSNFSQFNDDIDTYLPDTNNSISDLKENYEISLKSSNNFSKTSPRITVQNSVDMNAEIAATASTNNNTKSAIAINASQHSSNSGRSSARSSNSANSNDDEDLSNDNDFDSVFPSAKESTPNFTQSPKPRLSVPRFHALNPNEKRKFSYDKSSKFGGSQHTTFNVPSSIAKKRSNEKKRTESPHAIIRLQNSISRRRISHSSLNIKAPIMSEQSSNANSNDESSTTGFISSEITENTSSTIPRESKKIRQVTNPIKRLPDPEELEKLEEDIEKDVNSFGTEFSKLAFSQKSKKNDTPAQKQSTLSLSNFQDNESDEDDFFAEKSPQKGQKPLLQLNNLSPKQPQNSTQNDSPSKKMKFEEAFASLDEGSSDLDNFEWEGGGEPSSKPKGNQGPVLQLLPAKSPPNNQEKENETNLKPVASNPPSLNQFMEDNSDDNLFSPPDSAEGEPKKTPLKPLIQLGSPSKEKNSIKAEVDSNKKDPLSQFQEKDDSNDEDEDSFGFNPGPTDFQPLIQLNSSKNSSQQKEKDKETSKNDDSSLEKPKQKQNNPLVQFIENESDEDSDSFDFNPSSRNAQSQKPLLQLTTPSPIQKPADKNKKVITFSSGDEFPPLYNKKPNAQSSLNINSTINNKDDYSDSDLFEDLKKPESFTQINSEEKVDIFNTPTIEKGNKQKTIVANTVSPSNLRKFENFDLDDDDFQSGSKLDFKNNEIGTARFKLSDVGSSSNHSNLFGAKLNPIGSDHSSSSFDLNDQETLNEIEKKSKQEQNSSSPSLFSDVKSDSKLNNDENSESNEYSEIKMSSSLMNESIIDKHPKIEDKADENKKDNNKKNSQKDTSESSNKKESPNKNKIDNKKDSQKDKTEIDNRKSSNKIKDKEREKGKTDNKKESQKDKSENDKRKSSFKDKDKIDNKKESQKDKLENDNRKSSYKDKEKDKSNNKKDSQKDKAENDNRKDSYKSKNKAESKKDKTENDSKKDSHKSKDKDKIENSKKDSQKVKSHSLNNSKKDDLKSLSDSANTTQTDAEFNTSKSCISLSLNESRISQAESENLNTNQILSPSDWGFSSESIVALSKRTSNSILNSRSNIDESHEDDEKYESNTDVNTGEKITKKGSNSLKSRKENKKKNDQDDEGWSNGINSESDLNISKKSSLRRSQRKTDPSVVSWSNSAISDSDSNTIRKSSLRKSQRKTEVIVNWSNSNISESESSTLRNKSFRQSQLIKNSVVNWSDGESDSSILPKSSFRKSQRKRSSGVKWSSNSNTESDSASFDKSRKRKSPNKSNNNAVNWSASDNSESDSSLLLKSVLRKSQRHKESDKNQSRIDARPNHAAKIDDNEYWSNGNESDSLNNKMSRTITHNENIASKQNWTDSSASLSNSQELPKFTSIKDNKDNNKNKQKTSFTLSGNESESDSWGTDSDFEFQPSTRKADENNKTLKKHKDLSDKWSSSSNSSSSGCIRSAIKRTSSTPDPKKLKSFKSKRNKNEVDSTSEGFSSGETSDQNELRKNRSLIYRLKNKDETRQKSKTKSNLKSKDKREIGDESDDVKKKKLEEEKVKKNLNKAKRKDKSDDSEEITKQKSPSRSKQKDKSDNDSEEITKKKNSNRSKQKDKSDDSEEITKKKNSNRNKLKDKSDNDSEEITKKKNSNKNKLKDKSDNDSEEITKKKNSNRSKQKDKSDESEEISKLKSSIRSKQKDKSDESEETTKHKSSRKSKQKDESDNESEEITKKKNSSRNRLKDKSDESEEISKLKSSSRSKQKDKSDESEEYTKQKSSSKNKQKDRSDESSENIKKKNASKSKQKDKSDNESEDEKKRTNNSSKSKKKVKMDESEESEKERKSYLNKSKKNEEERRRKNKTKRNINFDSEETIKQKNSSKNKKNEIKRNSSYQLKRQTKSDIINEEKIKNSYKDKILNISSEYDDSESINKTKNKEVEKSKSSSLKVRPSLLDQTDENSKKINSKKSNKRSSHSSDNEDVSQLATKLKRNLISDDIESSEQISTQNKKSNKTTNIKTKYSKNYKDQQQKSKNKLNRSNKDDSATLSCDDSEDNSTNNNSKQPEIKSNKSSKSEKIKSKNSKNQKDEKKKNLDDDIETKKNENKNKTSKKEKKDNDNDNGKEIEKKKIKTNKKDQDEIEIEKENKDRKSEKENKDKKDSEVNEKEKKDSKLIKDNNDSEDSKEKNSTGNSKTNEINIISINDEDELIADDKKDSKNSKIDQNDKNNKTSKDSKSNCKLNEDEKDQEEAPKIKKEEEDQNEPKADEIEENKKLIDTKQEEKPIEKIDSEQTKDQIDMNEKELQIIEEEEEDKPEEIINQKSNVQSSLERKALIEDSHKPDDKEDSNLLSEMKEQDDNEKEQNLDNSKENEADQIVDKDNLQEKESKDNNNYLIKNEKNHPKKENKKLIKQNEESENYSKYVNNDISSFEAEKALATAERLTNLSSIDRKAKKDNDISQSLNSTEGLRAFVGTDESQQTQLYKFDNLKKKFEWDSDSSLELSFELPFDNKENSKESDSSFDHQDSSKKNDSGLTGVKSLNILSDDSKDNNKIENINDKSENLSLPDEKKHSLQSSSSSVQDIIQSINEKYPEFKNENENEEQNKSNIKDNNELNKDDNINLQPIESDMLKTDTDKSKEVVNNSVLTEKAEKDTIASSSSDLSLNSDAFDATFQDIAEKIDNSISITIDSLSKKDKETIESDDEESDFFLKSNDFNNNNKLNGIINKTLPKPENVTKTQENAGNSVVEASTGTQNKVRKRKKHRKVGETNLIENRNEDASQMSRIPKKNRSREEDEALHMRYSSRRELNPQNNNEMANSSPRRRKHRSPTPDLHSIQKVRRDQIRSKSTENNTVDSTRIDNLNQQQLLHHTQSSRQNHNQAHHHGSIPVSSRRAVNNSNNISTKNKINNNNRKKPPIPTIAINRLNETVSSIVGKNYQKGRTSSALSNNSGNEHKKSKHSHRSQLSNSSSISVSTDITSGEVPQMKSARRSESLDILNSSAKSKDKKSSYQNNNTNKNNSKRNNEKKKFNSTKLADSDSFEKPKLILHEMPLTINQNEAAFQRRLAADTNINQETKKVESAKPVHVTFEIDFQTLLLSKEKTKPKNPVQRPPWNEFPLRSLTKPKDSSRVAQLNNDYSMDKLIAELDSI